MSLIKLLVNPNRQLQLEAAVLFFACLWIYLWQGHDWSIFVYCFFVPDLAVILYLKNSQLGGLAYNTTHFLGFPIILAVIAFGIGFRPLEMISLIWISHLAFDRMLGWGLKFEDSFFNTHMGRKAFPFVHKAE